MELLSFVLPIYNEQANISKLWQELHILSLKLNDYKIEFIFINDGSIDNSAIELEKLHRAHPDLVKVINFSRNFGHQIAVTAGQEMAKGDAVIIMDTDLQDPPEVVLELVKKWQQGFDIVYAQREKYKTNFFKEKSAFLFYRILKSITNVQIPVDTGDFRLISKRVNLEMQKFKEKSRFLRGISSLTGFKQVGVKFNRKERFAGKPQYTFFKSLKLALDGITGFSVFPLHLISIVGFIFAGTSFVFGVGYVLYTLASKTEVSGWASLMSAVIFLGGVQLMMLGIIGQYLGRIYVQVLDRPLYTVENSLGFEKE
jgi:glycosyltransferase involved in cell wall biosynthesis